MWQRAQTLYLAISVILIGVMFFASKAAVYGAEGVTQTYSFIDYIPFFILLVIIEALNVLALSCYKQRIFQMRTTTLSAIITVAFQIWLLVDFFANKSEMVFRVTTIFPLFAVFFDILAIRGILADQLVVESAEHLRRSRREALAAKNKSNRKGRR